MATKEQEAMYLSHLEHFPLMISQLSADADRADAAAAKPIKTEEQLLREQYHTMFESGPSGGVR